MTRTSTIVTLAILSSVLTPVVVKATSPEAPAPQAKVEAAAVTTDSAAPSSCGRKVKVVYAGYGEGQGACATTAELRR